MPWRNTCTMEERISFIKAAEGGEVPLSVLCQQFGISRKTGYKWLSRFDRDGDQGLEDRRSSRVFTRSYPDAVFEILLSLRAKHPTWGPIKLKRHLDFRQPNEKWPSVSTIKEFLRRSGVSRYRRKYRSPIHTPHKTLSAMTSPNSVWCADFKGWFRTKDGHRCEPLTMIDGFSRYLLVCKNVNSRKFSVMQDIFSRAFYDYGTPSIMLTDNGPPFGSRGLCSLSPLSVWLIKKGIYPEKIRPGHPEDNGRQERFHKTLKADAISPASRNLQEQQKRFDIFRHEYNNERPHQSLGNMTPSMLYRHGSRRCSVKYEYSMEQTVTKVSSKGYIQFNGRTIYLTESLANEDIGIGPVQKNGRPLVFLGYPLGYLEQA